jgi:hypothetical protein
MGKLVAEKLVVGNPNRWENWQISKLVNGKFGGRENWEEGQFWGTGSSEN